MNYLLRRRKLGNTSCRMIAAKSASGIRVVRNDMRLPEEAAVVFRWGCTTTIPGNPTVINSAEAIHLVNDKTGFRRILQEKELCPATWFEEDQIRTPCVVRPWKHHQGRKLWVCRSLAEIRPAILRAGQGWYASYLIDKVAEYRVFCVSGRAVCVAKKTPANPEAVAWNVYQGGRFDNVSWENWPLKAVRVSLEAFKLSGLDFGGVDIMVDGEGECYVLEINAAPSLTSDYRQTCFTKAFDYIVRNGKGMIPLIQDKGGYRKFIHPAVCENAILCPAN